jgi:hypothetical protein
MGKPSQFPPGPITLQCAKGQEQFARMFRRWTRQWSQPQLLDLAKEALHDNVIHSSQLTKLSNSTLREPGPKCLYAIGVLNLLLSEGKLPVIKGLNFNNKQPMRLPDGKIVGPAEVFLVFAGVIDLGYGEAIPLEIENQVVAAFAKHIRGMLAEQGFDYAVEDRAALIKASSCYEQLITGKPISGDVLLEEIQAIAVPLNVSAEDLKAKLAEIIQTISG